ncbi:phosphoribosyltransferase-like protein [Methyloversatilis universalis]|uniref:phosphoribosyltransferase-like protein n=1 Tax=Methyloversatilis universalis TaxID=378211 RepID=UPI0006863523|nr:hypothetical protein [Methyloversatilis universalis]
MTPAEIERSLRTLVDHAWDREVTWGQIQAWAQNFNGATASEDDEQRHGLIALTRFLYFGKRQVREMLKSLYRDHFEAPLIQRIRKNFDNTRDTAILRRQYEQELAATRFVGVGNPSESGAHLLYYFRQINHLPKSLFVDFGGAFVEVNSGARSSPLRAVDSQVTRYVFFDDIVGSADQSSGYLKTKLRRVRKENPRLQIRFMCLFATTKGLETLNKPDLFDGMASCLFELDDSYKAFNPEQRYFPQSLAPSFDVLAFQNMATHYGNSLFPGWPLGYKDGQFMLGFTHNTPDNTLPIFWNEGRSVSWNPIFVRYDKVY